MSHHAHKERQAEKVTLEEVEQALLEGDIIERYLDDPRGESCLIVTNSLHVVCGWREEKIIVVTLYKPLPPDWIDYRTRAKEVKGHG